MWKTILTLILGLSLLTVTTAFVQLPAIVTNNEAVLSFPTFILTPLTYLGPSVQSPYELYGTSYMSNRGFMYDREIVALFRRVMTPPLTHAKVDYFNRGISRIVA